MTFTPGIFPSYLRYIKMTSQNREKDNISPLCAEMLCPALKKSLNCDFAYFFAVITL